MRLCTINLSERIQVKPAAPRKQLVTQFTRSYTYTRTKPKPNDGAMV
jgi:hypothetical protein